jgi:hypothetical protein
MLVNACFNIFILFKYPQYEDAQRNDAQSEIKDYLASNPAFAKHVVKGAAEFVAINPCIMELFFRSMYLLAAHPKNICNIFPFFNIYEYRNPQERCRKLGLIQRWI